MTIHKCSVFGNKKHLVQTDEEKKLDAKLVELIKAKGDDPNNTVLDVGYFHFDKTKNKWDPKYVCFDGRVNHFEKMAFLSKKFPEQLKSIDTDLNRLPLNVYVALAKATKGDCPQALEDLAALSHNLPKQMEDEFVRVSVKTLHVIFLECKKSHDEMKRDVAQFFGKIDSSSVVKKILGRLVESVLKNQTTYNGSTIPPEDEFDIMIDLLEAFASFNTEFPFNKLLYDCYDRYSNILNTHYEDFIVQRDAAIDSAKRKEWEKLIKEVDTKLKLFAVRKLDIRQPTDTW